MPARMPRPAARHAEVQMPRRQHRRTGLRPTIVRVAFPKLPHFSELHGSRFSVWQVRTKRSAVLSSSHVPRQLLPPRRRTAPAWVRVRTRCHASGVHGVLAAAAAADAERMQDAWAELLHGAKQLLH